MTLPKPSGLPDFTTQDATTYKQSLDLLAEGVPVWRALVKSTANVDLTSGLDIGATIDGVVLALDDEVFLNDQTAPAENGLYRVNMTAGAGVRSPVFNLFDRHVAATIRILSGTSINTSWIGTSVLGGTLGTTAITFVAGASGTDADAIHDNVAGEIAAITEKLIPVAADKLLLEDSADSDNKKFAQIGNLPYASNPNLFINGGFPMWQRGTSFASGAFQYTADRWGGRRSLSVAGVTFSQQPGVNGEFLIRVQRDVSNTSTEDPTFSYGMETRDSLPLAGRTVTFSCRARKGADFSEDTDDLFMSLKSGTGTDERIEFNFPTGDVVVSSIQARLTATFQTFTVTGVIPTDATQVGIRMSYAPVGTAGAADYFEIEEAKLEIGPVATPFVHPLTVGELAAAQRYYRLAGRGSSGGWESATNAGLAFEFPVEMRAAPTAVLLIDSLTITDPGVANRVATGATIAGTPDSKGAFISFSGFTGGVVSNPAVMNTDGAIEFDAEL